MIATRAALFLPLLLLAAAADDAEILAPLAAKGARSKKTAAGDAVEFSIAGSKELTLDDYRAVGRLRSLTRLNLSAEAIPFNDEAAALVGGLDRLEVFFSNGAKLSDDGFKPLAGWKSLKQIGFDHWFRSVKDKPIGAGLAHLAALPALESVRLGGCEVGPEAMEALATIKTLRKLDVFHTRYVTDDCLPVLQKLPELRIFIAGPQYSTRLTDAALRHLSGVKSLEEISLTETWLSYDGGFRHLSALPNLKKLSIPKVIASEEDVNRLKAELPKLAVDWTLPDAATVEKTKAEWIRKKAAPK